MIESKKIHQLTSHKIRKYFVSFSTAYRKFLRAVYAIFFYRIFESFSGSKQTGDIFRTMEKIGDRETAIADRVRALLEAANSTAAAVAGTVVPSAGVVRSASAPVTRSSRRLDPSLDPATVVANLTAAGIQLAVS
jgi:hypothetical protein